jgi:hypothetical protein
MKKVLVETENGTLELYDGGDGALYQEDPDPKMLGYSRVMWLSEAKQKGYTIVQCRE